MSAKTHWRLAVATQQQEALRLLSARPRVGLTSLLREAVGHLRVKHGNSNGAPKPELEKPSPAPKPWPETESHAAYSFAEAQARAERRRAEQLEVRRAVKGMTHEQQRRRLAELHPDKLGRAYTPAELEEYGLLHAATRHPLPPP